MKITIISADVHVVIDVPVVLRGNPPEGHPLINLHKGSLSLMHIVIGPDDDLDAAARMWLDDLIKTLNRSQEGKGEQ